MSLEGWAKSRKGGFPYAPPLAVPLVEQNSSYSCGAAATASVLRYWLGTAAPSAEENLRGPLGTDAVTGTDMRDIVRVATAAGLEAARREGLTINDLREILARGRTAILSLQAWGDGRSYAEDWASGHYAVLVGISDGKAYFADPSTPGAYAFVPSSRLEERWHDIDGSGKRLYGAAVVIWGERPMLEPTPPMVPPRAML